MSWEWTPDQVMELVYHRSRDNARTPMQWDASRNAGFTTGTPWLKVNPNYPRSTPRLPWRIPNSIFYYYQKLIQLRKDNPVIVYGRYDLLLPDDPEIYAFTRTLEDDRLLVILKFQRQHTGIRTAGRFARAG